MQHGWTQQDLAERLVRAAWFESQERVGVNADMVAKWERGAKGISPRYRRLLGLVLGSDDFALDITGRLRAATTTTSGSEDDTAVIATLRDAAALLDELGPTGAILQPRIFDAWRELLMRRRLVLTALGLASTRVLPASGSRLRASTTALTPTSIDDLNGLTQRYEDLYHSAAPAALLTPVVAHLATVDHLIRQANGANARRKLFANLARAATLAGRLAFFDLSDPVAARGYYNVALDAAREAEDHHQVTVVLGHVAFVAAGDHAVAAALGYLRGATDHVARRPHAPLASWLAAVESEIHADAGAHTEALDAVDRAREQLTQPGLTEQPPWFDYYDTTRLAGFAGRAALSAGRTDEARTILTGALADLPRGAVKQRAVFLTDLASAHLRDGDLDTACASATGAADELRRAGYATGSHRLREFRAAVRPWQDSRAVRLLDEQLATGMV